MITVSLAYLRPNLPEYYQQFQVAPGTTIAQLITLSGLLTQYPEIDLEKHKLGIFSQFSTPEAVLNDGDRVEIYCPLLIDPKDRRRKRAVTK